MVMPEQGTKTWRIKPVTEITPEIEELLAIDPAVIKRYGSRAPLGKEGAGPNFYAQLAHNPGLLRLFKPMTSFWGLQGLLPDRDREIAILRVAWLKQLPFVWGEHVRMGKEAGLNAEEIALIAQGSSAGGFNEHETAIIKAVEELQIHSNITDETWTILAKSWSEGQLIEMPMMVGTYQILGWMQAITEQPLWEGNPGLTAR
jgi:alkylhydroperoxidase family enzyme